MAKIIWLVFLVVLFSVVQGISGNVLYQKRIVVETGENVILNFTTQHRNPILATQLGLKGKKEDMIRKFIVVTQLHGIECGKDFNTSEGWRYKNRVYFVGNITAGHAWFKITNAHENDTNIYQVDIREKDDEKYKMYTVHLLVKRKKINEKSSPATPSVNTKQTKTEALVTKETTGIWNSNMAKVPTIEIPVKMYPKAIEVNRDPPYGWLIAANAVSFLYSMYTLYVKTRSSQQHIMISCHHTDRHEHETNNHMDAITVQLSNGRTLT